MKNTLKKLAAAATAALALAAPAFASDYPSRPITIIVPYAPGGSSDAIARRISQPLSEALGTSVVVENKAGANGALGAVQLTRAKPDGYTLLLGALGVLAINQGLYKNLGYLPERDFDMLTIAVRTPNAIVVNPKVPAHSIPELLTYLKSSGGKAPIATAGSESSEHLTLALFLQNAGTEGVHVPYKGGGPAISDTLAGHAEVLVSNLGNVAPYTKSGQLRLLAITGDKRDRMTPSTMTLAQAGVHGLDDVYSWQGIAAPKGLPPAIKQRLSEAILKVLTSDAFGRQMAELGFEVVANNGAEATAFQIREAARWKKVIEANNVKVD